MTKSKGKIYNPITGSTYITKGGHITGRIKPKEIKEKPVQWDKAGKKLYKEVLNYKINKFK